MDRNIENSLFFESDILASIRHNKINEICIKINESNVESLVITLEDEFIKNLQLKFKELKSSIKNKSSSSSEIKIADFFIKVFNYYINYAYKLHILREKLSYSYNDNSNEKLNIEGSIIQKLSIFKPMFTKVFDALVEIILADKISNTKSTEALMIILNQLKINNGLNDETYFKIINKSCFIYEMIFDSFFNHCKIKYSKYLDKYIQSNFIENKTLYKIFEVQYNNHLKNELFSSFLRVILADNNLTDFLNKQRVRTLNFCDNEVLFLFLLKEKEIFDDLHLLFLNKTSTNIFTYVKCYSGTELFFDDLKYVLDSINFNGDFDVISKIIHCGYLDNLFSQINNKVLVVGIPTNIILDFYINIIDSFTYLDSSYKLLKIISQIFHPYLISREDCTLSIAKLLLENDNIKNEDLYESKICRRNPFNSNYNIEEMYNSDKDLADDEEIDWTPQVYINRIEKQYRDKLSLLINIFGSADQFLQEYKIMIIKRFLNLKQDYNSSAYYFDEHHNIVLLEKKLDKSAISNLNIILNNIKDSLILNYIINLLYPFSNSPLINRKSNIQNVDITFNNKYYNDYILNGSCLYENNQYEQKIMMLIDLIPKSLINIKNSVKYFSNILLKELHNKNELGCQQESYLNICVISASYWQLKTKNFFFIEDENNHIYEEEIKPLNSFWYGNNGTKNNIIHELINNIKHNSKTSKEINDMFNKLKSNIIDYNNLKFKNNNNYNQTWEELINKLSYNVFEQYFPFSKILHDFSLFSFLFNVMNSNQSLKFYHNIGTVELDLEFTNGVFRFIVQPSSAVIIQQFENIEHCLNLDSIVKNTRLPKEEILSKLEFWNKIRVLSTKVDKNTNEISYFCNDTYIFNSAFNYICIKNNDYENQDIIYVLYEDMKLQFDIELFSNDKLLKTCEESIYTYLTSYGTKTFSEINRNLNDINNIHIQAEKLKNLLGKMVLEHKISKIGNYYKIIIK